MRIAVVNRDLDLGHVVSVAFELIGDVPVVSCREFETLLERMPRDPRDIVILDCEQEWASVFGNLQELQRFVPRQGEVVVVLLVSGGTEVPAAIATHALVRAVVTKPFEPEQLVARVLELCPQHGARGGDSPVPDLATTT